MGLVRRSVSGSFDEAFTAFRARLPGTSGIGRDSGSEPGVDDNVWWGPSAPTCGCLSDHGGDADDGGGDGGNSEEASGDDAGRNDKCSSDFGGFNPMVAARAKDPPAQTLGSLNLDGGPSRS